MPLSEFTFHQLIPFILSGICLVFSIILFQSGKIRPSLFLLFIGSLLLGFFICNLDQFLILWDEQFHALVAKNMMDHPFKPMLYATPVLNYDYKNWTANHIWLHKQPLFLWQIALSLKLFGISALSVRIPGIILHALLSLLIYRIGKISVSEKVGFYGALFFCVASYPLELIAGRHATDQNDIAFLFYLSASFWAWFEYKESKKFYWILLIGMFSGFAVLVKWLVGLMIFGIWLLALGIKDKNNRVRLRSYFPIVIAFCISLLIFIPWQLYILYYYPVEANYELLFNASHFFNALEDHGGDYWFHFKSLKELYGNFYIVPFLIAGLVILIKNIKRNEFRLALIFPIIFTYVFFTIAATKMASFCLLASPFLFLGLGALIDMAIRKLQLKVHSGNLVRFLSFMLLLSISILLVDIPRIKNYHAGQFPDDHYPRKEELAQMDFIHQLKAVGVNEKTVVFNAGIREKGYVPVMFYTNCIAYDFIPSEQQISTVRMKHYKMVILVKDSVPDYIMKDKDILKIKP